MTIALGTSPVAAKERERVHLLEEASAIVASASALGRKLTAAEDSRVLALMTRAHALEEEIQHRKRHCARIPA
jgi:hypothetical protein